MQKIYYLLLGLSIIYLSGCISNRSAPISPTASSLPTVGITPSTFPAPEVTPSIIPTVEGKSIASPMAAGTQYPTPEVGKATVVGQVYSLNSNKTLPYQFIYLAEVIRKEGKGYYVLNIGSDPVGTADANGYFIIPNIPPGEFVIVVGDIATALKPYEINGAPVVFNALADQILDAGKVSVDIEP